MRELVITKRGRGRFAWGLSLGKTQASVDQVPWWPLSTLLGPNGIEYPLFGTSLVGEKESIAPEFLGFVQQAYKASPVIFACVVNRMMLFSEARFQFRQRQDGRPGDLFGTPALLPLEQPWSGGTTGNLLALAEVMNSVAGNFFAVRDGDRIRSLRPDWTAVLLGSQQDPSIDAFDYNAEVIGYAFQPGGPGSGKDVEMFFPEDVAHYMPIPDPVCPFRGMSWITPVIEELLADKTLTSHKRKYLDAGATPNLAIKLNVEKVEEFNAWVAKHKEAREGAAGNPYATMFLGAVADPVPIGNNLQEIDFSKIQGAGEVRIAAAAMTHPAIAGFSEGLQGSALNAGNLNEVWRQFANGTMRPLWRIFAGSMERIIDVPTDRGPCELWYDDRDVPALQQDESDAAKILQIQAATIAALITAGYNPDSVVAAVTANDLKRLTHTGLVSVQLLPPGQSANPNPANALRLSVQHDAAQIAELMERGWTVVPEQNANGNGGGDPAAAAEAVERALEVAQR